MKMLASHMVKRPIDAPLQDAKESLDGVCADELAVVPSRVLAIPVRHETVRSELVLCEVVHFVLVRNQVRFGRDVLRQGCVGSAGNGVRPGWVKEHSALRAGIFK